MINGHPFVSPGFVSGRFKDSAIDYNRLCKAMATLDYDIALQRMIILNAADDEFAAIIACADILSSRASHMLRKDRYAAV